MLDSQPLLNELTVNKPNSQTGTSGLTFDLDNVTFPISQNPHVSPSQKIKNGIIDFSVSDGNKNWGTTPKVKNVSRIYRCYLHVLSFLFPFFVVASVYLSTTILVLFVTLCVCWMPQITLDAELCSIGPIYLLGRHTRCYLELKPNRCSWDMIHLHCKSVDAKEFAPKCILSPESNIYYSHKSLLLFVSFTYNTNNVVIKTEGGDDDMLQFSTVKRELQFGPVMVGGDTASSQKPHDVTEMMVSFK